MKVKQILSGVEIVIADIEVQLEASAGKWFDGQFLKSTSQQRFSTRRKNLEEISNKTKLGKSTILAWEAQEKFPKAVRLSKTRRVWLEQDVHHWMLNQHAERITEGL